ncbi:hypothetical protein B6N60_02356 [Richelia sinica FACHB-800]|uniref:DUF3598 domain-containing protein n=1 Tax=Richelia sinica FACHB-800 TaxID=1357546 RepID=A0A975T967_9NOST|nr:DUF3598 family protein [Richelia sinica]MBD2667326.1 DUF3598 family protein [Richelia sinica FACHB-800]QXE23666.1 hypothetical protein B6N60_02356 [Richelia sinica FACHB-800]
MTKQWQYLLKNLGEWQGSFTHYTPQGQMIKDIKSVVSLEGLNDNQIVRQTIRQGEKEQVLEYSSLSRSVMFFDNGAFSQGSIQLGPLSEFGAELGLIHENRRVRLVQLFNKQGQLDNLTLIREKLAGTTPIETPPLQLEDLLGEWHGEATTIYPDWRHGNTCPTHLSLKINEAGRLVQTLIFGEITLTTTATIKDSYLLFDQHPNKLIQVLFLPNGVSATSPLQLQLNQPLFLELGWLIQPNLRQRLLRSYDNRGTWFSLSLVTEHRVA